MLLVFFLILIWSSWQTKVHLWCQIWEVLLFFFFNNGWRPFNFTTGCVDFFFARISWFIKWVWISDHSHEESNGTKLVFLWTLALEEFTDGIYKSWVFWCQSLQILRVCNGGKMVDAGVSFLFLFIFKNLTNQLEFSNSLSF